MTSIINELASFGYGVYNIPNGYAVADPQDNEDGFYLEVETLPEMSRECHDIVTPD